MRKLLNWLLILSFATILIMGGLLYRSYKKSQVTDTTLLELNATLYQNPIQVKAGKVEDIARNLIFYTSTDGKELKEVTIEVLCCKQGTLNYIKIPLNAEITVDASLYQKLAAIYPEMPQYFRLSKLGELFEKDKRYAYGQLILDRMFSIDTSYYTVIGGDEADFKTYRNDLVRQYGLQSEEEIRKLIKQQYPDQKSNLAKKEKLKYAEYYAKVQQSSITEEIAEGTVHTDSFTIDVARLVVKLSEIKGEE